MSHIIKKNHKNKHKHKRKEKLLPENAMTKIITRKIRVELTKSRLNKEVQRSYNEVVIS